MATPKHRTQQGATYFVTTNTWQRRPLLKNAAIASIVENAIFHYRDQGNYFVHWHVVMPDHLHLLLTPGKTITLEKSVQLVKGGSSREIGKRPGMRFPVWQAGFTEHQIRDKADFDVHVKYIDENPVKAFLVAEAREYPYGSASGKFVLDSWPVASGAEALSMNTIEGAGLKPRPSGAEESKKLNASEARGLKPRPSEAQRKETK